MTSGPVVAPYGSWASPITAERIVAGGVRLGQIVLDGGIIHWSELRPAEAGRTTILRRGPDGTVAEVLPRGYSVRSKVHEYGGGAFCVAGGTLWFCNDADQRIYALPPSGSPSALSQGGPYRYADLLADPRRRRIVCVREDHGGEGKGGEPRNELVAIGADGGVAVLASGADFYAAPRLSADGVRLAWLQWNHPNMPWDGTELRVAALAPDGSPGAGSRAAGGPEEAIFQPEFGPDGALYYVSDRGGWWNVWRLAPAGAADCVYEIEAEFGLPHWAFGMRTYDFSGPGRIVAAFQMDGLSKLAEIDLATRAVRTIPVPHIEISGLRVSGGRAIYIGGGLRTPAAVVAVDLETGGVGVLRRSTEDAMDPATVSIAQPVTFRTAGGVEAHAFFYPPVNGGHDGLPGELPPLIVKSHGGPTGQAGCAYEPRVQFWTSRGFAVLDVNYRGSTGFGRAYRRLLDGAWGVADVEDCVAGARMLAGQGLVDGDRMAITGGSAGGYTTLCALTFTDTFRAGASHYGIGDLEALARDTHKFEARYLDRLVGRWPDAAATYRARSPIHHIDGLSCPVIFFQGLDDRVVPPNQAEAMVAALHGKGIPVAYVPFEGEGHGFRQAANIRRALEGELYFYGRVFGFTPADDIEPVEIEGEFGGDGVAEQDA